MNAAEFLLCLIDASKGTIQGRTLLQKRAFFAAILSGVNVDLGFDAHYYGPFSSRVEATATSLKNLGFLQESSTGFGVVSGGFEVKRYDYSITQDGELLLQQLRPTKEYASVKAAVERIVSSGDPNYVELSIAAKAFFLLRKKEASMSVQEIQREAERYNWSIAPSSISKAVSFLQSVGLAKTQ